MHFNIYYIDDILIVMSNSDLHTVLINTHIVSGLLFLTSFPYMNKNVKSKQITEQHQHKELTRTDVKVPH